MNKYLNSAGESRHKQYSDVCMCSCAQHVLIHDAGTLTPVFTSAVYLGNRDSTSAIPQLKVKFQDEAGVSMDYAHEHIRYPHLH